MLNKILLPIGISGSGYIIYNFIKIKSKIGNYPNKIDNYNQYKLYIKSGFAKKYISIIKYDNFFPLFYGLIYYSLNSQIINNILTLILIIMHSILDWIENLYQYRFIVGKSELTIKHHQGYTSIKKLKLFIIIINTTLSLLSIYRYF